MNLLAELDPINTAAVGDWLKILFFIVGGALAVVKLVSHFRATDPVVPNPVNISQIPHPVSRAEFETVKKEVHEMRQQMAGMVTKLDDIKDAGQERMLSLQALIEGIRVELMRDNEKHHLEILQRQTEILTSLRIRLNK